VKHAFRHRLPAQGRPAWAGAGFLLLFALVLVAAVSPAAAQQVKVPQLVGRVNDYAKLLDSRQAQAIEGSLAQFESETSTQVALLTVPSLDGADIETYGIRVAEAWKIGQKGKDNGVLLIVAPNDRKVRIEVGYGLEGVLPDATSSRIIRDVIVPSFKTGNYYAGIAGGLDAIMRATKNEFTAPEKKGGYTSRRAGSAFSTIFTIIIFLILISTRAGRFILFSSLLFGGRGGRGGFSGGGGFGGGGGGFGGGGSSGSW
jgi:uncharacterized protein